MCECRGVNARGHVCVLGRSAGGGTATAEHQHQPDKLGDRGSATHLSVSVSAYAYSRWRLARRSSLSSSPRIPHERSHAVDDVSYECKRRPLCSSGGCGGRTS